MKKNGVGAGLRMKRFKSGETIAEVMVSVVIFLLLVALLQGSVSFCTNAQRKSREIRENTSAAIDAYWAASDAYDSTAENNVLDVDTGNDVELEFLTQTNTSAFKVKMNLTKKSAGYNKTQTVTFYTFEKATGE